MMERLPIDQDHIEASRVTSIPDTIEVLLGRMSQSLALLRVDCFVGRGEALATRLDFDEDQRLAVERDQVDLTTRRLEPPSHQRVAELKQVRGGCVLGLRA